MGVAHSMNIVPDFLLSPRIDQVGLAGREADLAAARHRRAGGPARGDERRHRRGRRRRVDELGAGAVALGDAVQTLAEVHPPLLVHPAVNLGGSGGSEAQNEGRDCRRPGQKPCHAVPPWTARLAWRRRVPYTVGDAVSGARRGDRAARRGARGSRSSRRPPSRRRRRRYSGRAARDGPA